MTKIAATASIMPNLLLMPLPLEPLLSQLVLAVSLLSLKSVSSGTTEHILKFYTLFSSLASMCPNGLKYQYID